MDEIKNALLNSVATRNRDAFRQICVPLYQTGLFNYFIYTKIYPDKTRIYLCGDVDWFVSYNSNKQLYNLGVSNKITPNIGASAIPWYDYDNADFFTLIKKDFAMPEPLYLLEDQAGVTEIAIFAPSSKVSINYLLNHEKDTIYMFLLYFRDKAKKLIQLAHDDRAVLPRAQVADALVKKRLTSEGFCQGIEKNINRFYLSSPEQNVYITKQELYCIRGLIKGKCYKEIAKNLNISFRTVETHLEKARAKLSAATNYELVFKLTKLNLIK